MMHLRAHDYSHLIRRWRSVARASGLRMRPFSESGGFPLHFLETARPAAGAPCIYFSAGIHGDEAAATEGLVTWAEENPLLLKSLQVLIFPCLNPWGLVNNCRLDRQGRDLNRCYGKRKAPQIRDQLRVMKNRLFDLALTLHEDYDARGIYIYEVAEQKPYWAEKLLAAAAPHVPVETRRIIEGRAARDGIVRKKISPDMMPDWPEAFLLHFTHAARTFTVETPSELHIGCRVAAQVAVTGEAVSQCLAQGHAGCL
jgi:hypothetical protein